MTDDAMAEMPKYKCHKEVWALQIAAVVVGEDVKDGSAMLTFVNTHKAPLKVDPEYVRKHNPQAGGYYVVYEGGYKSWSPKDVFRKGYAPTVDRQMAPKLFGETCFALRIDIDLEIAQVRETMKHPGIEPDVEASKAQCGEAKANIMLAVRHLQDAKMRLGLAFEAYEGK